MSDEPEILRDRYVLVAELGRGGMGVVWRAYDQILKRNVAIKQIDLGTDRALANRTVREAQITAMINHPNIVKIHDIFEDGNNFYAVMELIDGVGLDKLIDSRSRTDSACPIGTSNPRTSSSTAAVRHTSSTSGFRGPPITPGSPRKVR
jgi:serine/threonine protein kinase